MRRNRRDSALCAYNARVRAVLLVLLLAGCGREEFEVGADHDGDGIADLGDSCPTKYDQGAEDRDGDGVGDACDPHPGTQDFFVIEAWFGRKDVTHFERVVPVRI